jgi:hypothetical protein
MSTNDFCPTCSGPYVVRCRCPRGDMRCAAGHEWHTCPLCKRATPGESDHAFDLRAAYCPQCAAGADVDAFGGSDL